MIEADWKRKKMAQIPVLKLEDDIIEKLKKRAMRHGSSLQNEVRQILTQSAGMSRKEALKMVRQWQKKLSGRTFPNTTKLLGQDRSR